MASTDENHGANVDMPASSTNGWNADCIADGEISLEEWQSFFNKVWHDEGPPSEQIDQTMEYLLFGRESLTHWNDKSIVTKMLQCDLSIPTVDTTLQHR